MAFCTNCGAQVNNGASFCPNCGAPMDNAPQWDHQDQNQGYQNQNYYPPQNNYAPPVVDNGGFGWGLLGFCFPIVGLILYLVWKDNKPRTGKAAGKGALVSVIVSVAFYLIAALIAAVAGAVFG